METTIPTAKAATATNMGITLMYPDRLPGALPDFTRTIWTSGAARAVWEPRLTRIAGAWSNIERESVVRRLRRAALTTLTPEQLPEAMRWAATHQLTCLVLGQQGRATMYGNGAIPKVAGQPWDYRVVYLHPADAASWLAAWDAGDNDTLGQLLGYPTCCRAFFDRVWVQAACCDTSWAMAGETMRHAGLPAPDQVAAFHPEQWVPEANILLRWLGVRAVPHLPCRFDCMETISAGQRFLSLGQELGYTEEMVWLRALLSWPVEWSGLHGIAEIKTPLLKLSTRTDLTAGKYTVQLASSVYPDEGATGVRFPYPRRHPLRQRSMGSSVPLIPIGKSTPPVAQTPNHPNRSSRPESNGFQTLHAQSAAHSAILQAVRGANITGDQVCDLGAGDGTLAVAVAEQLRATGWVGGIEMDAGRAKTAVAGATILAGDFIHQPELWPGPYDVVLLMPGRLQEVADPLAERVRRLLKARTPIIVVYAYGDWLKRSDLHTLVRTTGLASPDWWLGSYVEGDGVAAAVLRRDVPPPSYLGD